MSNKKNNTIKLKHKKTKHTKHTKYSKKHKNTKEVQNSNTPSSSLTSLVDFKKSKSLTILSKPSDIKTITSVGEFYNLLDIHDNINKNCINKVKDKSIDGVQLNKNIAKTICTCLFEKNKDLTIEKLEIDTNNKIQTPGSSCISILDKFIKEENDKSSKSRKTRKSSKSN